jgi:DNA-binding response OmpR family regulator
MPHILVVDDEPDILRVLESALQPCASTRVTTVRRSLIARSVLMRETVDLVIADARMPGESGVSLAQAAAELGIPTIIITGDAEWAIRQGAPPDDLLLKPFDAEALRARVERYFR